MIQGNGLKRWIWEKGFLVLVFPNGQKLSAFCASFYLWKKLTGHPFQKFPRVTFQKVQLTLAPVRDGIPVLP